MDNWLFIAILILLPIIWVFLHYSTARKYKQIYSLHKKPQNFHGVSIQLCSGACENVKSLDGKRFLANEVTVLPVFGCTTEKCTCIYEHHRDRRSGIERRLPLSVLENVFSEADLRVRSDRRKQSFA